MTHVQIAALFMINLGFFFYGVRVGGRRREHCDLRELKGHWPDDTCFLTHTSVSSAARAACPNPTCGPPLAGACVLRQSATRTSFQSSQFAKFLEIVNNRRLFCRVVELPYIVDFFIKM